MDPNVILQQVIENFWGPLSFYHWLVGTIIIAFCSIGIFFQPANKNAYVLPYQIAGVLFRYEFQKLCQYFCNLIFYKLTNFIVYLLIQVNPSLICFSVAAFMFIENNYQLRPEILPLFGASTVLGIL